MVAQWQKAFHEALAGVDVADHHVATDEEEQAPEDGPLDDDAVLNAIS